MLALNPLRLLRPVLYFCKMISRLNAVSFLRFMSSGRTSPALCGCEDNAGSEAGEYVVKLRGAIRDGGSANELISSLMAVYFGLACPAPAIIRMSPPLIQLIAEFDPSKSQISNASAGLNFGSKALIGYSTWPVDNMIPEYLRQRAAEIFAFDALLQNPDRRFNNPNLFIKGDEFVVFDHELAFSFLLDVFPSSSPWILDRQVYLRDHVFYRQLKSKSLDLTGFTTALSNVEDSVLEGLFADIPQEWKNESGLRIQEHLISMRDHAEEFAEQVRRFLA